MASHLTVDGVNVFFTFSKWTVGCEEPWCRNIAVGVCSHALIGRRAGEACGRRFCAAHGVALTIGDPFLCGAHARLKMNRKDTANG